MKKNRVLQPSDHPVTWYPIDGKYQPRDRHDRVNLLYPSGRILSMGAWYIESAFCKATHWSYPLKVRDE